MLKKKKAGTFSIQMWTLLRTKTCLLLAHTHESVPQTLLVSTVILASWHWKNHDYSQIRNNLLEKLYSHPTHGIQTTMQWILKWPTYYTQPLLGSVLHIPCPFLGPWAAPTSLSQTFPFSMLITHSEWQAPRAWEAEAYRDNRYNSPPSSPRNVWTQCISPIYSLHLRRGKGFIQIYSNYNVLILLKPTECILNQ